MIHRMEQAKGGSKDAEVIEGSLIETPYQIRLPGQLADKSPNLTSLHEGVELSSDIFLTPGQWLVGYAPDTLIRGDQYAPGAALQGGRLKKNTRFPILASSMA